MLTNNLESLEELWKCTGDGFCCSEISETLAVSTLLIVYVIEKYSGEQPKAEFIVRQY